MSENEANSGKRFRLKFSHVLIILLLICIGVFVYYRLSLKSKLQARIGAIRAAGYPVTCAELDQWYKIPPNVENASYTIIDAFSYYKKWDKDKSEPLPVIGQAKLPARTEPLPEEMKVLIAQYIADNNEALERLHAGAAIEHSRFPIDLNAGLNTLLPHLTEIRTGVKLLKLETILHSEDGDGESAVRSAMSIFGIARSLAKEPLVVSQLSRTSCQNLATTTIEYCINRIEPTDKQLIQLIDCVHNSELISDMSCAFVGERCMGLSFFKAPELMDPDIINGIPAKPIVEIYKAIGLADADEIIYLDIMEGYIKSNRLPFHKRQEALKAINTRLTSTSQIHILLHIIMPALSRISTLDLRTIALMRTARTALAIERYRLASNKLPDKLADLVPAYLDAVQIDPFDGNKLRYKKLEVGFVVYSIGEDLIDDSGKEIPTVKKEKGDSWDVTFIVVR
ncbi:MAG: hypothetical protein JXA81_07050 [Sedimentisphaerales bacterium]|nr:hypothetical protein [Sedimentisphaerales bacterium]